MSLYANLDDDDAGQVATNSGWSDFSKWSATLIGANELRQLTEYGLADDAEQLAADLRGAIENGDPTPDQKSIAIGLLAIADRAENDQVITVTDGCGVTSNAD